MGGWVSLNVVVPLPVFIWLSLVYRNWMRQGPAVANSACGSDQIMFTPLTLMYWPPTGEGYAVMTFIPALCKQSFHYENKCFFGLSIYYLLTIY